MGLIIDTSVIIRAERRRDARFFARFDLHGDAAISVITVSELLVGVHLAETEARANRRLAFVEAILSSIPAIDFTAETARIHSHIYALLRRQGETIGAHDLIIAATALGHGWGVLTANPRDFERVEGLQVVAP